MMLVRAYLKAKEELKQFVGNARLALDSGSILYQFGSILWGLVRGACHQPLEFLLCIGPAAQQSSLEHELGHFELD
jgi:hypothetical protein